jgi:lambda family phage portal protein
VKQRRPNMQLVKPTALDRAIAVVSPSWAFKRVQYRSALAMFDAGSRGKRTKNWRTNNASINADTRRGLDLLRSRARDLAQNNGYAAAAHRELPANIVGAGIMPHIDLPQREDRTEGERLAKGWFDTTDCDIEGRQNFYGIENLVARTVVESGECLVRRLKIRAPGSNIPLQLQVMEPDHLDASKDGVSNGDNVIIQGVEFDRLGRRVAYWLFPHHPGDAFYRMTDIQSQRVPASEILHIFRVERTGQVRGVPWGAPVLIRLRDFDEFTDAHLVRQKIAACFSVFIVPGNELGLMAGQSDPDEMNRPLPERVEPGMIEDLSGGKDVRFANPPGVDGVADYSRISLQEVSSGYGAPYNLLTGDLRQVNFSSGKMGDRAFNRNVRHWQQNMMIPQLCQPVWRWFMEACMAVREIREPVPARWTPPPRELTDPPREIPALGRAVRNGLLSQRKALEERGYDPDDYLDELQAWNKELDDRGIVLDTDPRKTSTTGLTQARPDGSVLPPTSTEDDHEDEE